MGSRRTLTFVRGGVLVTLWLLAGQERPCFGDQPRQQVIRQSLAGEHAFRLGDDPAWSRADFDDANWETISVPGTWQAAGIAETAWIGWYRIHFRTEAWMRAAPVGVLLGQISDADEVWLNGRRVGGSGVIGRRYATATFLHRAYELPREALRSGGDNVLAIRVLRPYYEGGILGGSLPGEPGLGNLQELRLVQLQRESLANGVLAVLVTFYLAAALLGLSLFRDRELRGAYLLLSVFMLLYAALSVLGSVWSVRAGLLTPTSELLGNVLLVAIPIVFLELMGRMLQQSIPQWLRVMNTMFAVVYGLAVVGCGPELRWAAIIASVPMILVPSVAGFVLTVRAMRQGVPGAGVILFGHGLLTVGHVSPIVAGWTIVLVTGLPIDTFAAAGFVICAFAVLVIRFRLLRTQLEATSHALLVTQEEERRRLSRELHDGANQSIFAMRLALQMAHEQAADGGSVDAESLAELVRETEVVSDELRRIVAELRPSVLEQMSLVDALKWHADEMSKRSALEISVTTRGDTATHGAVKDHLFRIWQEALKNVIQHAEASRVDVTIEGHGALIEIAIRDDGTGLRAARPAKLRGHGLTTIRERAELLGGNATFESQSGQGTTVTVRVPRQMEM